MRNDSATNNPGVLKPMPPKGRPSAPTSSSARSAVAKLKASFHRQNQILVGLLFLVAAVLPATSFFEGWMASQASLVIIYILAAQGVAILTGYTGLVTAGHGGFLAIGAYTSALLAKYYQVDLFVGLVAGGAVAGVIGCLLALIFLRLSGAFMAIGTLGFAFFIGTIVNNVPIFEGRDGISLPKNRIFGVVIDDFGFYYVSLAVLALSTLFIYNLVRSSVGRAFKALRDSAKAAESSGINRLLYRTLAFTISAVLTGMAGVLNGHIVRYVSAEVYGDIWYSVDILVAVVVGGSAMLMGPFVGGVFIVMLPFFLETMADFSFILKGVVLILMLQFAPAGLCDVIARPLRAWRRQKLLSVTNGQRDSKPAMRSASAAGGD